VRRGRVKTKRCFCIISQSGIAILQAPPKQRTNMTITLARSFNPTQTPKKEVVSRGITIERPINPTKTGRDLTLVRPFNIIKVFNERIIGRNTILERFFNLVRTCASYKQQSPNFYFLFFKLLIF
jgi:hypothetical protein